MKVNVYKRPNGAHSVINMSHISAATEEFFLKNHVVISLEEIPDDGVFICYAEVEWLEDFCAIHLSKGEHCIDAMERLKAEFIREIKKVSSEDPRHAALLRSIKDMRIH